MRVLITGGAGYLGSVMTRRFLELGYEVIVVDNFMYRQQSLLDCCRSPMFDIIRCDCRDVDAYRKKLSRADIVIPLAAITGAPACDHDKVAAKSINLDAVWDLCRSLSNQQLVIYPNTNSGYGTAEGETSECTEESLLDPISYYGQLKCVAEKIVLDREVSTVFRLATVFGASPRMRLDLLVNDFVYRALTDRFVVLFQSWFKRNYISIHDVVNAFAFAIENIEKMKGQVYNLGLDSANLSKRELCNLIKTHITDFTIVDAEIGEDPDKRNYVVSSKKLSAIGFYPQITLEQGIIELVKAYAIVRRTEFSNV